MGKISDIPKLKAALAQRMDKLGGQGVGMSDKTAERAGLIPCEVCNSTRDHDAGGWRECSNCGKPKPRVVDGAYMTVETSKGVRRFTQYTPPKNGNDWGPPKDSSVSTDPNCGDDGNDPTVKMLLAENERLTLEVVRLKDDIRRRTKMFDPSTGAEVDFDPLAKLDDIAQELRRFPGAEGYTLVGAAHQVVERAREAYEAHREAESLGAQFRDKRPAAVIRELAARLSNLPGGGDPAECAALLGLEAVKVEPGMLLAIREPGPDSPVPPSALKRMANALLSELTKRFGSMTPTVITIPHGSALEAVPAKIGHDFQVTFRPERHAARAYAEAAAASYGVTPDVVQERRKTPFARSVRRRLAAFAAARIATDEPPFITPEVRAERKPIGQVLDWGDPEAFIADAED